MVQQTMFEQSQADAGKSWYKMPILSEGSNAQACTRHAMEIDFIPGLRTDDHDRHNHFIFASQDLPMFCKVFLFQNPEILLRMELWIIIGDEIGIAGKEPAHLSTSTDGKSVGSNTAAMKNAAAIGESPIMNPDEGGDATWEDSMEDGSTMAYTMEEAKSTLSESPISTRARRLLEPFRVLHSIGCSYIDAPISESYRLEIHDSLSRDGPSIHHIFSVACSAFDEAIATFDSRNFGLAISKIRGTLDTLQDYAYESEHINAAEEVTTGQSSTVDQQAAINRMTGILWEKLARAYLEFPKDLQHVRAALTLAESYLDSCDLDWVFQPDTHAHERAMGHYLKAEIWDALDQLGENNWRTRPDALRNVVTILEDGLQLEPGNPTLLEERHRRLKEIEEAKTMEKVWETERPEGEWLSSIAQMGRRSFVRRFRIHQ